MYTRLIAVIYLAFISLGLPDSLLGAGWPDMYQGFGVPVSYMGIISMIISGGTIVSSLLSDRLTRKMGTKWVTIISVFLTVVAMFGFSLSTKFWMLILFAIPYGLGAGAIDAALNNYVALHYKSRYMSWLHCFWGVGAIISPFVMGYALTTSTWENGYRIVGYIQLAIGIILLVTLPLWKANERVETEKQAKIGLFKALKIKGVPYLLIGFFAYCAMEATAMHWASTYFVHVKGLPVEHAAKFASLFYIGITSGRFLSGFITEKLGDRKMILLGTSILFLGIILLLIPSQSTILSPVAFITIGFGCAPIYPCIIHSTPFNFGKENSGAIIGIQMASAYVGSTFIPPLFGLIANRVGFKILPIYLIVFVGLMLVMVELTFRKTKNRIKEDENEGKSQIK